MVKVEGARKGECSRQDIEMFIAAHDVYPWNRGIATLIGMLLLAYMGAVRQDPFWFAAPLCLGLVFFLIAVSDAIPLLLLKRKFGIDLMARKSDSPSLQTLLRSATTYMGIGIALMFVSAAIEVVTELPYM